LKGYKLKLQRMRGLPATVLDALETLLPRATRWT